MSILITKQSGETAPFSKDSLRKSLLNSGADEIDAEKICQKIEKEIYNGITTKELYEKAFKLLKEIRSSIAARYSLKRALQDLGPEGFYFEKWVARFSRFRGMIL